MTAPTPLEYRTPTSAPRRQVFSVPAFLIVGLPILTIYAVMAFVVPKFVLIFRDFGTTLPTPTYALLGLSRAVMRFGWIPLITLPPAAGLTIPLIAPDPRHRRMRVMMGLMFIIANIVILAFIVIALALPMFSLIQSTAGK